MGTINNRYQNQASVNYLVNVLTENGKCDAEIWRCTGIAKEAFQKLSNILKHGKISLETNTRSRKLLCQWIFGYFLFGDEIWSNRNVVLEKGAENAVDWKCEKRWRVKESKRKKTHIIRMRKRQVNTLGHINKEIMLPSEEGLGVA